jgi:outer membrane biosynthesis protein TonB
MRTRLIGTVLVVALLMFAAACKKKKPEVPPPQAQAPTVTQPTPAQPPTTETQTPAQTEEQKKTGETAPTNKPANKPKPRTSAHKKPQPEMKKPVPPATANTTKPATPPVNGESGQLTASLSAPEVIRKRQDTAQLLVGTDNELKSITRALSTEEQNIVVQIRGFMQQAQAADRDGDLDRSHVLAVKAKLLADDLVKKQ